MTITTRWFGFAKGGSFSPYYSDLSLALNWENDGDELKKWVVSNPGDPRTTHWSRRIANSDLFFRPGLTWPLRTTSRISFRALPAGCIFGHKGPALFVANDDSYSLLGVLGIVNSAVFEALVKLQLGAAAAAARSYEVGIVQSTPIPNQLDDRLALLAHRAHDLQRERSLTDETTHVFQLPALVAARAESLPAASQALAQGEAERARQLAAIQAHIDAIAFDLYGLDEADRQAVMREMGAFNSAPLAEGEGAGGEGDEPDEDDEAAAPNDLPAQAQNLLMWCVGVAFGRWDVRKALDPSRFPPLPGPFDPLPRCAPGALMNADGLPAGWGDVPLDYPLPIAWDGVLADDPAQESDPASGDIVARARGVLTLLWGERADAIERECCAALGVRDLRDYFRHPSKGFFPFHIKRYSKSRRKAPIYWLLQSERRHYGLWLYYPRIDANTLFVAENVAYSKVQREQLRLAEMEEVLKSLDRADRKRREHALDAQRRLVEDVVGFHKAVLRLANLGLPPDHNDGVLISIAPLHELVPWKEAAAMWARLARGEFAWSTMSAQMRRRGMITG